MSSSTAEHHLRVTKAVGDYVPADEHRLVIIEYQAGYALTRAFDIFSVEEIVYRLSTVFSGFRHARLLVLTPTDGDRQFFHGKVWDYGDQSQKQGCLQGDGKVWTYDPTSTFLLESSTAVSDTVVSTEAAHLAQWDYHLAENNCETFCERLAAIIAGSKEAYNVNRTRQVHWQSPGGFLRFDKWGVRTIITKNALRFRVTFAATMLTAWFTESEWRTTAMLLVAQTATLMLCLLPVFGPSLPQFILQTFVILAVTTLKLLLTVDLLEAAFAFAYMLFCWLGTVLIGMIWEYLQNSRSTSSSS